MTPPLRSLLEPGKYSVFVHFAFASLVGGTMLVVGAFITWRVQRTQEAINEVHEHIKTHTKLSERILHNQDLILERLK